MASRLRTNFPATYGRQRDPMRLDDQEFRFTVMRPEISKAKSFPFDDRLEQVEWRDEGTDRNLNTIPVLRGTITWRADDEDLDQGTVDIRDGHQVRCEVKWLGKWEPLWQMRIVAPPQVAVESGATTAELADDLVLASKSQGTFRYRKGKKRHKKGWRYHEIVADVCKRYKLPIGAMVRGTTWIEVSGSSMSPLEIIRQAVKKEEEATGRRLVIAWRPRKSHGRWSFGLHVIRPLRNPMLYTMRAQIRGATSAPVRRAGLATSVVATGSAKKKGGKRRKLSARVTADGRGNSVLRKGKRVAGSNYVRRFGFIERHVKVARNTTRAALRREAKRQLAKNLTLVRALQNFTHYGIAFVRRGDVVKIDLPEQGFKGKAAYMFVVSVTHTLTPGDYQMALDLTWRDPLDPNELRKLREAAIRRRKRAARKAK